MGLTVIIYHPRSDIYHCMFRFINIAQSLGKDEFEWTRLRIYDLFYLFPHLVNDIEFPRTKGLAGIKKSFSKIVIPYERLPDKKRLFSEMGDYHIQALHILKSKNIFKESNGVIQLSCGFHSESIQKLLENNNNELTPLFFKLFQILNNVEIAGDNGLKKRTGLMEYRYDAV